LGTSSFAAISLDFIVAFHPTQVKSTALATDAPTTRDSADRFRRRAAARDA